MSQHYSWAQSGYPQVTGRGRVEALGVVFESGRPKVLSVRCLSRIKMNNTQKETIFDGQKKRMLLSVVEIAYRQLLSNVSSLIQVFPNEELEKA